MDLGQESTPFLSSIKQEKLSPNRRGTLVNYSIVPTSNVSTNSIGISSTSSNQKAVVSEAQPGISPSSSSPVSASNCFVSTNPIGFQSSPVFNVVLQSKCVRCSQFSDLNKSLFSKISELQSKHDEEMKESRTKMKREFEQKLLEHRANLETITKEAEKKLDALNLELRLQLVKSKEENISLQQENLKILKNSVSVEKFNKLKELYDRKMETCSSIADLETLKIVHNKEMKGLEEKLEKEYEKKLMDQQIDLEKKAKSKLDQLRKELTKFLDISIDTKAQPEKEIDKDEEVMIINESFASQSNRKKETNNPIVLDCEPAQKKQKLSIPSIQSHASTDGPRGSLPSIGRELVESDDKLGYTEIPDNHCAVRICTICRWVEKSHNIHYKHHFKKAHNESLSKESNFQKAIMPDSIYYTLKTKSTRSQISAEQIDSYRIPENYCFMLICPICRWTNNTDNNSFHAHWKHNHNSTEIKSSIFLQFKIVLIEKSKYLQLRKSQYQIASNKRSDNSTPEKNSKEGAPKSILKSLNKSNSCNQKTGKKRSSQVPMKTRKSLRFQLT
ncbi:uncharacterized protein LOC128392407 [Panonychus citri]|uniref:uncharacterized protein LOC128392407 n=1 Tax=Panonychus citri TaxID=50023 RepID=UPI002306FA5C|nr:uncharacterized protein LOC128392407 [Panonychus citri]